MLINYKIIFVKYKRRYPTKNNPQSHNTHQKANKMTSKFSFSFVVLFLSLQFCTLSFTQTLPVMKFTTALPEGSPPVIMGCKTGRLERGSYTFKPVDNYELKAYVNDIYYCLAVFGSKFTSIHAFDPARDKGHATIYWQIDVEFGFSISYDNANFNVSDPWQSE